MKIGLLKSAEFDRKEQVMISRHPLAHRDKYSVLITLD